MRLSPEQNAAIRPSVAAVFGPDAHVRPIGSRMDDAALGGDIDPHIAADGNPAELPNRERRGHARLIRRLRDRRTDRVVHRRGQPWQPIDEALRTGVVL